MCLKIGFIVMVTGACVVGAGVAAAVVVVLGVVAAAVVVVVVALVVVVTGAGLVGFGFHFC